MKGRRERAQGMGLKRERGPSKGRGHDEDGFCKGEGRRRMGFERERRGFVRERAGGGWGSEKERAGQGWYFKERGQEEHGFEKGRGKGDRGRGGPSKELGRLSPSFNLRSALFVASAN
jgi:hypothetical protein